MNMPLTHTEVIKAANWISKNFADKIAKAVAGSPFNINHVISIALQESAQDWLPWIDHYSTSQILSCIISDPTGDQPGTVRNVWPQNLTVFKTKYPDLVEMLVSEGNKFRSMPKPNYPNGWQPRTWLYKAWGIFQYDIQAIKWDVEFFRNKEWYSFDSCLKRLMAELNSKLVIAKGDPWLAIERYNGAGQAAKEYRQNVMQFHEWIA